MKFQQIRNATVIITFAGKRFLVDPWLDPKDACDPIPFARDPTQRFPIFPLPLPIEKIIDVDAIIVTHMHVDHFSEYSANLLNKEIPIFAQDEEEKEILDKLGFKHAEVLSKDVTTFGNISIYRTNTNHGEEKIYDAFHMKRAVAGFVLSSPSESKKIYLVAY
ncbi:beta lactamase, putative [Trichomonas vaginalis G3]|uniref:Beta lactamase, putative n=1 Tax=Trichomonas vaginalis (strain ATCC PRA-98 / G3) TaxID=412133 RepID=A2E6V3_TRIV3|nr:beta-lactamase superfamily domain-containing protein [Trichomonas vaginalis G3]EAY11589.1 beta lactamase, putative [Trichomonas vaginalis G3]KAI5516528.1 beta-lactamase superfamily domain-containing protein [Trichomonas vaginalis G3]|eukprot:XP_001323812.1 beta lactamase [Trichomonas vaginalis G3]